MRAISKALNEIYELGLEQKLTTEEAMSKARLLLGMKSPLGNSLGRGAH